MERVKVVVKTLSVRKRETLAPLEKAAQDLSAKSDLLKKESEAVLSDLRLSYHEKEEWEERIARAEEDLTKHHLSVSGKEAIQRLLTQAKQFKEIAEEEYKAKNEMYEKMKTQLNRNTKTLKRLENIEYESSLDISISTRRRELGMAEDFPRSESKEDLLREVKQTEYAIDALIKLRNNNGNH